MLIGVIGVALTAETRGQELQGAKPVLLDGEFETAARSRRVLMAASHSIAPRAAYRRSWSTS